MFLTRTKPRIYLPAVMMAWATVSACTALVQNYSGLVACRFLLGELHRALSSFLSADYTSRLRGSTLLSRSFISTFHILHTQGVSFTHRHHVYRSSSIHRVLWVDRGSVLCDFGRRSRYCWLALAVSTRPYSIDLTLLAEIFSSFIIEGVTTFGVAVIGIFLLCDDPADTKWLTEDERALAVARIKQDTVGDEGRASVWSGLRQAATDPKLWVFVLMQNLHLSACSFNNFFPTIVASLGFKSKITALLLTAPPYFVSGLLGIPFAWSSGRFNERTWHITGGFGLAVIGFAMSCASMNTAVRYTSTFLYATGAYSVGSVILGWVSATLSQTPEKKSVSYAIVNSFANLSYVYTAYLWPKSDSPRYITGFSAMLAFTAGSILCAWVMRFWLVSINKTIKRSENEHQVLYAY